MKTLGQLLNTLYGYQDLNMSDISSKLQNLPVDESLKQASTAVKNAAIYKTVSALNASASLSGDLIGQIDDLITDLRIPTEESGTISITIANKIQQCFPDVGLYNIATLLGKPVYVNVINDGDHLCWMIDVRKLGRKIDYYDVEDRGLLIDWAEGAGEYVVSDATGKFPVNEGSAIDVSALSDNCDATANTMECLKQIVDAANVTGEITPQQVNEIIAQYGATDSLDQLKTYISGLPSMSSTTILSIVAKCLSNAEGSYTETQDYYTPYSTPTYVDDIISLVTNLALTIVPIILSVVFRSFALIIAIAFDALTKLITYIKDKLVITECEIKKVGSTLPIWNYPIATSGLMDLYDHPKYSEIQEFCENFGCASLLLNDTGTPSVCIVFPTGKYNQQTGHPLYIVQLLPCANNYNYVSGKIPGSEVIWADQQSFHTMTISRTDLVQLEVKSVDPLETDYVYADNHSLFDTLTKSIIDSMVSNLLGDVFDVTLYFPNAGWPSLGQVMSSLAENPSLTIEERRFCIWSYIQACVNDRNMKYGEVFNYDYGNLSNFLSDEFLTDVPIFDGTVATRFASRSVAVVNGIDALTPTIEWPLLKKADLIWTCVLTAVSAAAVVAGSFVVKKQLKKKAVARLSLREAQFEDAKKAYQADQSKTNLDKMNKANRKLTRAWNKAGKVGVSMYNGFSCGSSSVEGLSDVVSSFDTSSIQNKEALGVMDILALISPKYQLQPE